MNNAVTVESFPLRTAGARVAIVLLVALWLALIIFIFTLWTTKPEILAGIGMGSALMYSILRIVSRTLTMSKENDHGTAGHHYCMSLVVCKRNSNKFYQNSFNLISLLLLLQGLA